MAENKIKSRLFYKNIDHVISEMRQMSFYGHNTLSEKSDRWMRERLHFIVQGLRIERANALQMEDNSKERLKESMSGVFSFRAEKDDQRAIMLHLMAKLGDWTELDKAYVASKQNRTCLNALVSSGCVIENENKKYKLNQNLFEGFDDSEMDDFIQVMNFMLFGSPFSTPAYMLKQKALIWKGDVGQAQNENDLCKFNNVMYHSVLDEYYVWKIVEALKKHNYVYLEYVQKQESVVYMIIPLLIVMDTLYERTHLIGMDESGELKTFRMDRILHVNISKEQYEEKKICENEAIRESLDAIKRAWGISASKECHKIVLEFKSNQYDVLNQNRIKDAAIINLGQSIRYEAYVNDYKELKSWILGFGDSCKVIEPDGLREEIIEAAKQLQGVQGKNFVKAKNVHVKTEKVAESRFGGNEKLTSDEKEYMSQYNLQAAINNHIFVKECRILNYILNHSENGEYTTETIKTCEKFFKGSEYHAEMEECWTHFFVEDELSFGGDDNEEILFIGKERKEGYIDESLIPTDGKLQPMFRVFDVAYMNECMQNGSFDMFLEPHTLDKLKKNISIYCKALSEDNKRLLDLSINDFILYKGQSNYKDDWKSNEYQEKMHIVKACIQSGTKLSYRDTVWNKPEMCCIDGTIIAPGEYVFEMSPESFEYSALEQKMKVIGIASVQIKDQEKKFVKIHAYLSNMKNVVALDEAADRTSDMKDEVESERTEITLILKNRRNSLERVIPRFQGYEFALRPCGKDGDDQLYYMKITYPMREERRILIRLLSVCGHIIAIEEEDKKNKYIQLAEHMLKQYE